MPFEIHHGDCLEVLRTLADASVHAIVTDPPYGLSFMGKRWDYDVPSVDVWAECLRVLKPGGHLLAFAGTRTQHRMAVRIEDAGFEIRDMIAWVYGSGFPKSLDVSKAIDKAAGAERERGPVDPVRASRLVNQVDGSVSTGGNWKHGGRCTTIDPPATEAARQWDGWGTALKPALEPITVARKPLAGTVAANVLAHGTGALNIDGCRVGDSKRAPGSLSKTENKVYGAGLGGHAQDGTESDHNPNIGRWPANLIHDGSEEVLAAFPQANGQQGAVTGSEPSSKTNAVYGQFNGRPATTPRGDTGSAARFFYCAKASKKDRDEGLEGFERAPRLGVGALRDGGRESQPRANIHPTVKPTDLMRYLCRLVTPPGGVVLDPFMGSGSTGRGAVLEGFRFVGIECEEEYVAIALARIEHAVTQYRAATAQAALFEGEAA